MRNFALYVSCFAALIISACAAEGNLPQQNPDSSSSKSDSSSGFGVQKGALSAIINPGTQLPQDCTPPFDVNCTALGPTDQQTCFPTGLNTGTCQLYSTDDYAKYADQFITFDNTFTYISCPGTATTTDLTDPLVVAENDFCATKNPFPNKGDYTSRCFVTEKTAKAEGDHGRCAYFLQMCVMAPDTVCEASGYLIAGTTTCSVGANMGNAAKFETCGDNVDNDCNGKTDEEGAVGAKEYWIDGDGDKYGSTGAATKLLCAPANSYTATVGGDCNDSSGLINPGASETCDGVDNNCSGKSDETFLDLDASCGVGACTGGKMVCSADGTKTVCSFASKASSEVCDGKDNDCNGKTDETYSDLASSCGVGACAGGAMMCLADKSGTECSTAINAISELCDNQDNDCNGKTDETYLDLASSCGVGACVGGKMVCTANKAGTVCSSLGNAVTETCDNVDNDCNGKTDETYLDLASSCGVGACVGGAMVCSADGTKTVCSSASKASSETCDGADNDCNGKTDETYKDLNASCGVGACAGGAKVCSADKAGTVCSSASKAGVEICNQIDDDCDGTTDIDGNGKALCDLKCPTVQKYDCNVEYEIDFSTLKGANTINSYNCWTSAGAKTNPNTFNSPELFMAPNAKNGTKFSFMFTTAGTGAAVSTLHGTCDPNQGTTAVSAYNLSKNLNGTCSGFSPTSASGTVGDDYLGVDKVSATGKVKFKFVCAP